MGNYSQLKAAINAVITANGQNEITGTVLNNVLNTMVTSIGSGYLFKGVATPSTAPGTPDQNVFYVGGKGTYPNFGSTPVTIGTNEIGFFKYDGTWHAEQIIDISDGVFDVSEEFPTSGVDGGNTYTFDTAVALIPTNRQKGGMSMKYIQSSDNRYVQFRLMSDSFNTTVANWQGVEDEPTAGSNNLVNSGGLFSKFAILPQNGIMYEKRDVFNNNNDQINIGNVIQLKRGDYISIELKNIVFNETSEGGFCVIYLRTPERVVKLSTYINSSSSDYQYAKFVCTEDTEIQYYGASYTGCTYSCDAIIRLGDSAMFYDRIKENTQGISNNTTNLGFNEFDGNTSDGFLGTGGAKNSSPSLGKVTDYIPVSEGDKFYYHGGWANHDIIGMVWGYDSNKENGVKLVKGESEIQSIIEVTSGISYIRAWSANGKPMKLYKKDSVFYQLGDVNVILNREDANITTITATRNAANYNSIREIVAGITDASEKNRYIIKVPKGEWFECDLNGKKYVKIVGESMTETILYCDGNSENVTPEDYSISAYANTPLNQINQIYKHCIMQRYDVDMSNLTIRADSCKYCFHVGASDRDGDFNNANFENCLFYAINSNCPVGIGAEDYNADFVNCIFKQYGRLAAGIFVHNHPNATSPIVINVINGFFDGCDFGSIDECGSDTEDIVNFINCYSSSIGSVTYFVDPQLRWTNPSTGVYETDPTLYPYAIKVNMVGCNVGMVKDRPIGTYYRTRPNALKYLKCNHYICLADNSYSVGQVLRGFIDVLTNYTPSVNAPVLGVVERIIDGIAYVAKDRVFLEYSDVTRGDGGSLAYVDSNGKITNVQNGEPIGIFDIGYYDCFVSVILNK